MFKADVCQQEFEVKKEKTQVFIIVVVDIVFVFVILGRIREEREIRKSMLVEANKKKCSRTAKQSSEESKIFQFIQG